MPVLGLTVAVPAQAADAPLPVGVSVKPHVMDLSGTAATALACVPVAARFLNRWNQNPGGYGCATSTEFPYANGTFQRFANGEMDWSPSQGPNMIVSGMKYTYWDDYGAHTGIYFAFGPSDPYNYDAWLIRTYFNGGYAGQAECRCNRTTGGYNWGNVGPGHYQFIVEGCDVDWTGSHTCRQGWTLPVDLLI
jgi:hypothetical protein